MHNQEPAEEANIVKPYLRDLAEGEVAKVQGWLPAGAIRLEAIRYRNTLLAMEGVDFRFNVHSKEKRVSFEATLDEQTPGAMHRLIDRMRTSFKQHLGYGAMVH